MTLDFTLEKYRKLCEVIQSLDCPVMAVREFLASGQPEEFIIVLRHDVDRQPRAALRMAELETKNHFNSTYYFRKRSTVFKPDILAQLYTLGHEVGYHYEVLSKTKGDMQKAIRLFEQELRSFREIGPVSTISMHGMPLSSWNNLDLWDVYDYKEYHLIGEATLSIRRSNLYYFTDTGRTWHTSKYNLRDYVSSRKPPRNLYTTNDLIAFLEKRPPYPIYISVHPNRWAANTFSWIIGVLADWSINQAKKAIKLMRL